MCTLQLYHQTLENYHGGPSTSECVTVEVFPGAFELFLPNLATVVKLPNDLLHKGQSGDHLLNAPKQWIRQNKS